MPAGVDLGMVVAVLLPIAVVTVLLRQLPFSFVRVLKESQLIGLLGITMPVGVMTVLVVYTLRSQAELSGGVAAACLAAAVTAALHLWRRHSALSIFGGTAFYMVLVNLVF